MPFRKTTIAINEYYHCYNRGTEKCKIFLTNKDYLRFMVLLYVCNSDKQIHISNFKTKSFVEMLELFNIKRGKPLVAIGSWCLMPNHFHLLLKEITENGVSKFMNKLSVAYSMYFNMSQCRKGTLFEGRFRAEHANSDKYLKYIFSYIHLNPVKLIDYKWKKQGLKNLKKTKEFLNIYEYSSYLDYKGKERPQNKILNKKEFPCYFEKLEDFEEEIFGWLFYKN